MENTFVKNECMCMCVYLQIGMGMMARMRMSLLGGSMDDQNRPHFWKI